MRQFSAYRNLNQASSGMFPFLLNIQSDLVDELSARVVVPLADAATYRGRRIDALMPKLEVTGQVCIMLTHQLSAVRIKELGAEVDHLATQRTTIMAALDLLISGV